MSHADFLTRQHKTVTACLAALDDLNDILEQGQIPRRGLATVSHVESLMALLEAYKEGTATLIYRPEWDVAP